MISKSNKIIARRMVFFCSFLMASSLSLAASQASRSDKMEWSGNISGSHNDPPQLIHKKDYNFYALVCISSNQPPTGPVKFTVNHQAGTRFNKAGCWLDAISDIYLAEGHANGTIADLGPTSKQLRPLNFNFSNVTGEETDLLAIPPESPVNVKICVEKMSAAGSIKFTIKYYGDEPPVDRWEVPQYPINAKHFDCPEFRHVVAIWLDHGDGEGNVNSIPVSGTVYVE